uniref:Gag protein n=1 Tax=Anopheles atroparvus TaxID=41427 RepID=A0AAG5CPY3_ANOAO
MNRSEKFNKLRNLPTLSELEDSDNMEELAGKLGEMMAAINALQGQYQTLASSHSSPRDIPIGDYYRIPDPIKSLQPFEGNRKQLSAWLNTAENTLNLFKGKVPHDLYCTYVTAVTNKISGKAKDILCLAGNPQDFDQVKEILISSLGDRQELSTYKCQMWQNRMTDSMNIHHYYQTSKEIVQNIKTLAKQNAKYLAHWDAINSFIDEDALAAFIAGLRAPYFGHAQAARPKDIEDAYAFLCKYKAQELNAIAHERGPKKQLLNNQRKFQNEEKAKFEPQKPNRANSVRKFSKQNDAPEPMDIDPSLRTKLSHIRKQYNNNEAETEDEGSEDEEELAEGNFCIANKDKEGI